MYKKYPFYLCLMFFISSCGGGGGGGGDAPTPTPPLPSISFSADLSSQLINSNVILTWSSTNSNSCSASGSWSGSRNTSGTETVTIAGVGNNSFTLSCTGSGGSRSSTVSVEGYRETEGIVVDGYISGAEVCIDEDSNFICDTSEFSTTSDNDGKFKLRYSDGSLVSLGGTDLDSQTLLDNFLITHKMLGYSEFKAVTPVTSVASFLCINNSDCSLSGTDINTLLGIDQSLDIYSFDPVANKGDDGINDFLYEKGNQLTVLAFALQNITNDLNNISETTQDYFKAIAEELDNEYSLTESRIDIETESFISKVFENLINAKGISIDETLKQSTITSLAGVMPVISVKANNDLTTAVIRFGVSTLQTDIVSIANGTASQDLVDNYTENVIEYIAEDQNIDSNEITPDVTALDDTISTDEDNEVTIAVLVNDSYVTTAPVSISGFTDGNNGSTRLSESSNQIIYTPDQDFNGSDSFTYKILQGDKSSTAEVIVNISAVNDEPSIDIASTIQTPENQLIVTTIPITDVDGDDLTLTISGSDAAAFNLSSNQVLSFISEPDYEGEKVSFGLTLDLSDGEFFISKEITIQITNVNDNSPNVESTSFSVDESCSALDSNNCSSGSTYIGQISATDIDGDPLSFSTSNSDFTITNSGVLNFVSPPDFETKQTHSVIISAFDGVFSTDKEIEVNINDLNDETPIFGSTSYNFFSGILENQLSVGTVTATDADADSQLTFSLSGDDGDMFNVESKLIDGVWTGIITFKENPDYETKNLFNTILAVSDGVQGGDRSQQIIVDNVLEDVIDYSWNISDGTISTPPVLTASISVDLLMNPKKVYFDLGQFASSVGINCAGYGYEIIEMDQNTKSSSQNFRTWSLNYQLSDEISELCKYAPTFYFNFYDTEVESAPPSPGIHLSSGNKRLRDNNLQYSAQYNPTPPMRTDQLTNINNIRSDNDNEEFNGYTTYFYLESQNYPASCTTYQYSYFPANPFGDPIELIETPIIAVIDSQCATALTLNTSSDSEKIKYDFSFYNLEPVSQAYTYMLAPSKTDFFYGNNDARAMSSRELLVTMGTISQNNSRIFSSSFEFDKSVLPEQARFEGWDSFNLHVQAVDESGIRYTAREVPIINTEDFSGSEADNTPPVVNDITISTYTSEDYPQRNFAKFEVDVINDNEFGGSITSIRDFWIGISGGRCEQKTLYVRDDLDGKIATDTANITATIPFLKADEGTWRVTYFNINDHGYAENYYTNARGTSPVRGESVELQVHDAIGYEFTVGDGSGPTCPFFEYNINTKISVKENVKFIGNFPATGGTSDTITYEIQFPSGLNAPSIVNLVQVDSNGTLSFINPPDEEGDIDYSGVVELVARSSLNSELTSSLVITVGIEDINDNAPIIESVPSSVNENQTEVGCINVTDADNDTLYVGECSNPANVYYSLTLPELSEGEVGLSINNDGKLYFETPPDYETQTSASAVLGVFDGVFETTEEITIQINDVNDNFPIVGSSTFTSDENVLLVGQISVTDNDTNSSFTFEILSDYMDGSLFSIDADGIISFVNNPNYEDQSTYKIKVVVDDGANYITQELTIILNDVIAEAIPTLANINLLPKTLNSSSIQLQSFVIEGRTATFSIESDGLLGTSILNTSSGELTYETSLTDADTDQIIFKVNDGAGNESTAKLTINLNTDPLYKYQWHLDNTAQTNFASTPGVSGEDMNIKDVIASGYTGLGLTISVIDEGLEIAHEDLAPNVLSGKSYNFLDGSNDPTSSNTDGDHGTSVAGIIASKGWNNIGGRGVAPNANLVGYNYLEYQANSAESYSFGLDNNLVSADIFNMSYGRFLYPGSTSFSFPNNLWGPSIVIDGFINGVNNLRNGKGGIYIKSMGNNYSSNATNGSACGEEGVDEEGAMTCGIEFHDFRHLHPYIIGVGALGADGIKSSYSTVGPSIWVSSPGGEYGYNTDLGWSGAAKYFEPAILTTDQTSCNKGYVSSNSSNRNAFNNSSNPHPDNPECKYTSGFNGTSSAAPNIAGGVAVLLEAYPNLTWREVKHVIANSSRKIDVNRKYERSNITQYEWRENAAGYNFHNWYGFGAFDLDAALEFSSNFILNSLGTFSNYGWSYSPDNTKNQLIPSSSLIENSIDYQPDTSNNFVEFIQLAIYLTKDTPRDLGFSLVSPQGTEMNIIQPFTNVSGNPNGDWFVLGVSGFYGENLKGEWKLKVIDYTNNGDEGILNDWGINIYGN